jgi:uncharacterized membrane protein YgcG
MKTISAIAAILVLGTFGASAQEFVSDASTPTPVANVCGGEKLSVTQVAACWDGNGSASKQFGSEGGSDSSSSGEGEGGSAGDGGAAQ